jgi:hypothetical protein
MAVRAMHSLKGINTKAGYFPLKIDRSYGWQEQKIGITPAALKQARQKSEFIFGLGRSGVRFQNEAIKLPSIFIRTRGKSTGIDSIFTVLLSDEELTGLGDMFGFNPDKCGALAGAFFEVKEKALIKRLAFSLRPIWSELLEPQWRDQFLSWIAGEGDRPDPAEFDWKTSLPGFLTFPALLPQVNFSPANRRTISGKMLLREDNGFFRAYFYYYDKFSVYRLSQDSVEFLESGKIDSGDTYSKNSFLELLGLRPKRTTYDFFRTLRKMTSRKVFSLGNIMGEPTGIHANKHCRLKVGTRYHIRVQRDGDWLRIRCFTDAKSDQPACFANVLLTNGEISNSYIILNGAD